MAYKWLSLGQNHQEYQSISLWPKYIKLVLSANQSSLVAVVPQTAFPVLLTGFYKANRAKTRVLHQGHYTLYKLSLKTHHFQMKQFLKATLDVCSLCTYIPPSPLRRPLPAKCTYPFFKFGRLNAADLNKQLIQIRRQTQRTDPSHCIAMGTNMAVAFSVILMAHVEK